MDCVINLDEKPFYLLVKASGVASVGDMIRLLEELSVPKDCPAGIGILLDLRDLDLATLSSFSLLHFIDNIHQYMGKGVSGPCALVVDNPVAFGVARMYGLLGGEMLHSSYNVFYNPDDAVLWLLGCVLLQEKSEAGMNKTIGWI